MNEEWQDELRVIISEVDEMPIKEYEIQTKLESIKLDGTKKQHEKISDELSEIIDEYRTDLEDWFVQIEDVRRKLLRENE